MPAPLQQFLKLISLSLIGGYYQLAQPAVADAVFLAKLVEGLVSGQAQPGLERALRVVDAGVDDAAVAAAYFLAELGVLFQYENISSPTGQPGGDGQADDTGADDGNIGLVRYISSRAPLLLPS